MIEIKTTSPKQLEKRIDQVAAGLRKAQLNAIKVEGFSLRETLRQAIIMGRYAPGVKPKDLSMIARTVNRLSGGVRQPIPLRKLASAITYQVDPAAMSMRVGFTSRSAPWAISAATKQQSGWTRPITWKMREMMAWRGTLRRMSRKSVGRRTGNPLLLRRETRRFVIPQRPIVAPFWAHERDRSVERIRRNFRIIAAGLNAPGGNIYSVNEMAGW